MATWEERMNVPHQQKTDTSAADILRIATKASLREAYEPHLLAQKAFWEAITAFLAKHGSLMYEAPNFDLPHFTTGPMALKEVEIDSKTNRTLPVPSIQISSYEDRLIWGFFDKRGNNPLTRYLPPSEEKTRAAIRKAYAESALIESPHFPYIEVETKYVEFADTYTEGLRGVARQSGGIYRSRVPKALLKESDLLIFPDTPPPNLKAFGYSKGSMRLGPPTVPDLGFGQYNPEWSTEEIYHRSLKQQTEELIALRDAEIASMSEIADIICKADQIHLPLYDYFGRTNL